METDGEEVDDTVKPSCRNCVGLDMQKKEEREGRLKGKYRYGCSRQKSGYICGFLSSDDSLDILICGGWLGHGNQKENKKELSKEYETRLQEMYNRWNQWKESGCPEAEATDGVYLNRIRTGIERLCQRIETQLSEEEYPECYYAMLPPVMEESYMANGGRILRNAKLVLLEYESNEDYLWLCEHRHTIESGTEAETESYRLFCHADALREAIESGDLFSMKRESRQERLFEDLSACRKLVQKQVEKKQKRRGRKQETALVGQMELPETKAS